MVVPDRIKKREQQRMKIKQKGAQRAQRVVIGLNVIVITGLVVCLILAGLLMEQSHRATELLVNTNNLAKELRQSSDDLTRFIRTFTVTGNESYWDYFQQVVAIRDGKAPLPKEPSRNFWDLFIATGKAPRGYSEPSALIDRIKSTDFTEYEISLLEESKRRSDALIDLETVAYNAMFGKYRPSNTTGLTETEAMAFSVTAPANQTLAQQLVHSVEYHVWKGDIMSALDEFAGHSHDRVASAEATNYQVHVLIIGLLAAMLLALIVLLLFYFLKISKDAETQRYMKAVLPAHVANNVDLRDFTNLGTVAEQQLAKFHYQAISSYPNGRGGGSFSASEAPEQFPVLFCEHVSVCWVGFLDVMSFTGMCRGLEANAVISLLNQLISILDIEMKMSGIEKVRSVGDTYMVIHQNGGLRGDAETTTGSFDSDHSGVGTYVARNGMCVLRFLLRSMQVAKTIKHIPVSPKNNNSKTDQQPLPALRLSLRGGMHVGPVVTGVIGFGKPTYEIIGETVDVAHEMKRTSQRNTVQVQSDTLSLFDQFEKDIMFDESGATAAQPPAPPTASDDDDVDQLQKKERRSKVEEITLSEDPPQSTTNPQQHHDGSLPSFDVDETEKKEEGGFQRSEEHRKRLSSPKQHRPAHTTKFISCILTSDKDLLLNHVQEEVAVPLQIAPELFLGEGEAHTAEPSPPRRNPLIKEGSSGSNQGGFAENFVASNHAMLPLHALPTSSS